ncbi:S8 family serine peptidase [Croceicoccus mobilis]|nr:S8 family serine peptidase [Croceicoccus mobilis]
MSLAAPAGAQIGLPQPSLPVPVVGPVVSQTLDGVDRATLDIERQIETLARQRVRSINRLLRDNRQSIELDRQGSPARRGELLVLDADDAALEAARQEGFTILSDDRIDGLDMAVVRLRVPETMDLAEAEELVGRIMPEAQVAADNLHFPAGHAVTPAAAQSHSAASETDIPVGMIDSAPARGDAVTEVRGFASGAPLPADHGTAVASLLSASGIRRIRAADVYGSDKAGGNALAIAKALGWLTASKSKVVTISLVGPRNAVLERAIAASQAKGVVVVAAVGNDGPAAPPAFPASYDGVVAVTGVDGRRRALIEAGKALHLDYAAPGADIFGRNAKGKRVRLRGTSFATPLVAARIAWAKSAGIYWRRALDAEAIDLGSKGEDPIYGRGLVCGACKGAR